jgi:4-carboxymuconolactone decarboxylase
MSDDPREKSERFRRGRDELKAIMGEGQIARLDAAYADVAPDMVEFLVSFAFGDLYARKALKPRDRQLATIAALTALGTATPQLRSHIKAGLTAGLTREEIVEVLMQMAVYAGFPAALNGLAAAKEVFAQTAKN